ncbi:MAG: c-type cytochrome, partial [Gammaproteobacteria bacterium]
EVKLLGSEVKTGILEGAMLYPGQTPLKPVDKAFSLLGVSVVGSILQHYIPIDLNAEEQKDRNELGKFISLFKAEVEKIEDLRTVGSLDDIKGAFKTKAADPTGPYPYESRVLQGIWAAAPYLHNGSVPTLTELLTPAAKRVAEFKIGPAYDIDKVGLAVEQTKFNFTLKTTDCSNRNSGDSRCGHDYGTSFSDIEKKALLEYLKSL